MTTREELRRVWVVSVGGVSGLGLLGGVLSGALSISPGEGEHGPARDDHQGQRLRLVLREPTPDCSGRMPLRVVVLPGFDALNITDALKTAAARALPQAGRGVA